MTPQEKAKDLVNEMDGCKGYALTCVEEIMKEVAYINEGVQSIDWLTVKAEIEKL